MNESDFLRYLLEHPDDDDTLRNYLAFLESSGDSRSSTLRLIIAERTIKRDLRDLESQIASDDPPPEWLDIVQPFRVRSPGVGHVWLNPTPDAAPYVTVGSMIHRGMVVAQFESMKIFSQLIAEFDGVVTHVLVENGSAVEYNQDLFRVRRHSFDYW